MADIVKYRGARPSPAHKLLAAVPYRMLTAPPDEFAVVPKQLSMWGNSQYGVCVTSEEAFAKAAYSLMCGLPETFIPESEVINWARKYGYLNGADLVEVMDEMAKDGLDAGGVDYRDGGYRGVNYSDEPTLKSALTVGPVKIAIAADALPDEAGNNSGWWTTNNRRFTNTDHCVGICGFGSARFLFGKLGLPVPTGLDPNLQGYLIFTWNTIGFVTHPWLMGTCVEAWVRNPTTVGQSPAPAPTPTPVPPGPTPMPAGLYALSVGADGSMTFTPRTAGPINITPSTTMQELVNAMGGGTSSMAFPPFIVKLLQIVCPFAAFIPPPIGPVLVGMCALLPHGIKGPDGSVTVTLTPDLAMKLRVLRGSPTTDTAGFPQEVKDLEVWFRGQSSFQQPCGNCN